MEITIPLYYMDAFAGILTMWAVIMAYAVYRFLSGLFPGA